MNEYKIFKLKEIRIEEIVKGYMELMKDRKNKSQYSCIVPKFQFLLHVIIKRCRNKENCAPFNYEVLAAVLGKNHTLDMLNTLVEMQIIVRDADYKISKYSKHIKLLCTDVELVVTKNKKIMDYNNKLEEILESHRISNLMKSGAGEILRPYEKSLGMLQLVDYDKAIEYIENRKFHNEMSKKYYVNKIEDFHLLADEHRVISSIDKNGRIYHYMTNLPRELKKFFNIKFQCDVHNSHPLLFSLFLVEHYNLSDNLINLLLSLDIQYLLEFKSLDNNNKSICYDVKKIRKSLRSRGICRSEIKGLPMDVLLYIFITSKGCFWDVFIKMLFKKNVGRNKIKEEMFKEVFYSKRYKSTRNRYFAKIFRGLYPNVWKYIKTLKENSTEDNNLPCQMMKKESELFREILKECFKRKWKVISIHDAIEVLDVEQNKDIKANELKELMENVYKKRNIHASISIDTYKCA